MHRFHRFDYRPKIKEFLEFFNRFGSFKLRFTDYSLELLSQARALNSYECSNQC